jgi:cell division protein FtsW
MDDAQDKCLRLTWRENSPGLGVMLATVGLLAFGVVMITSAVSTLNEAKSFFDRRDVKHDLFVLGSLAVLVSLWLFDYRWLVPKKRSFPWLLACIFALAIFSGLLVYVPGIGHAVGGRHRWVRVPGTGIGFQPSEVITMAMVFFLSAWLTRRTAEPKSFLRGFLPGMLVVAISSGTVIRENFSMGVLIAATGFATLFLAGVRWPYLVAAFLAACGPAYYMMHSSPVRWQRIQALLNPWDPSNPAAYQARQSLLTIMTGGYFGKGLGNGMLKRGFLPEGHTDFIFSVFCEEWGLIGAVLLVGLVVLWIWQARRAAGCTRDSFGRTLAGSLGFLIALQAIMHVAVDLVAFPPTGIGCPFISFGGTRLVTTAAATAIIISVSAHRGAPEPLPDLACTPAQRDSCPQPA